MCSLLNILVLLSCVPTELFAASLPSYLHICRRYDPQLSNCIKDSINDLRVKMPLGIPQLHIPPLEPMLIPEVKLDQNSGSVFLHSTYTDIEVRGLSKFIIQEVQANVKNNTLDIKIFFPSVNMKANYTLQGKILMMPLLGEGLCMANLSDITVLANVSGSRYHKNDLEHLKIDDVKLSYDIKGTKLRLDNLFNGDNNLGEKMNDFLNENWYAVSEEIRPIMEDAMAEVLRETTKKLFEVYTYDQLLPE